MDSTMGTDALVSPMALVLPASTSASIAPHAAL